MHTLTSKKSPVKNKPGTLKLNRLTTHNAHSFCVNIRSEPCSRPAYFSSQVKLCNVIYKRKQTSTYITVKCIYLEDFSPLKGHVKSCLGFGHVLDVLHCPVAFEVSVIWVAKQSLVEIEVFVLHQIPGLIVCSFFFVDFIVSWCYVYTSLHSGQNSVCDVDIDLE